MLVSKNEMGMKSIKLFKKKLNGIAIESNRLNESVSK